MDRFSVIETESLALALRGAVPMDELPALIRFIAEYASADVIDEAEMDHLIERFTDSDTA